MTKRGDSAEYKRFLIRNANLLVVRGSIDPVLAGMSAYNSRHGIGHPPPELLPVVRELLAATALAALSLAERESWGWSVTFGGMDVGFFVGIEPEGMICLRIREADQDKASVMVQKQKAGFPMTQSHISPRTDRPRDLVEQYFSEVEQTRTRLEVAADGADVLVHALPGGDFNAVAGLDAAQLADFVDSAVAGGSTVETGGALLLYGCRCSQELISTMIRNLKESDRAELFAGVPQLDVECPRCGRKYTVAKAETSVH